MRKASVLNIGIDLGTSRSVISCDNGIRTFVPSYVGFPKDAVSRKMFKKDIVFGDEVLRNRLALEVHRPFDKGRLKYTDSLEEDSEENKKAKRVAKELLKHLVSLATEEEETEGLVIRGVIGAPALASIGSSFKSSAASSAKDATINEWWYEPGASIAISLKMGRSEFVSSRSLLCVAISKRFSNPGRKTKTRAVASNP